MDWKIKAKLKSTNDFLNILLSGRGLDTAEEIDRFLSPPPILKILKNLPEDFKKSAKEAVKLIESSVEKDLPIVIHGDYDCDGICAAAILSRVLRNELGHKKTFSFIPNRFEHGYGLSNESIDDCKYKLESKLGKFDEAVLITVDSGITSVESVKYAKEQGFNVIITDHHQKSDTVPSADVVVWSDEMVGAGIAWVLGRLLKSKDRSLLGLAALATVTDLQPLFNYNRSIVKEGLSVLNTDPVLGIDVLHQVSGRKDNEITTYDLGWVIGPRINAAGRMGSADTALALLLEDDFDKALDFAEELNRINVERQDKTSKMYELATDFSEDDLPKVIVSSNESYHEGIIGLVASKLVEKHYRPSIVMSLDGDIAKGSVRSISGVNIIEMLRNFEDMFEGLGGHPMAAGFSIKSTNVELFRKKIVEYSSEYIKDEHLEPILEVDMEIPVSIVDMNFIRSLEELKPHGVGNRSPVFVSRNLGVAKINVVGRDNSHLSLDLMDLESKKVYKSIYFSGASFADEIKLGDKVDVVYKAKENNFRGRTYVNLVIQDIKKAG